VSSAQSSSQPTSQPTSRTAPASAPHPSAPVLVVMGVSGSGKSTVGAAIAQRLRVPFADADDFHPPANIAKMTAGRALDDADREPWLEAIGEWLDAAHPAGGVMSCSALKRKYRDQLRHHAPGVEFLHLEGSPEVIGRRQASRPGHFMPASLLASQFATLEPLEPDEHGEVIDVDQSIDAIVQQYVDRLDAPSPEHAPRSKEK
jgi:gluconokinase